MRRRELIRDLEAIRHMLRMLYGDARSFRVGEQVEAACNCLSEAVARLKESDGQWKPEST